MCEDLWDDHEAALSKMALQPSARYALSLCADEFEVCDEKQSRQKLYAYDPDALSSVPKDEV